MKVLARDAVRLARILLRVEHPDVPALALEVNLALPLAARGTLRHAPAVRRLRHAAVAAFALAGPRRVSDLLDRRQKTLEFELRETRGFGRRSGTSSDLGRLRPGRPVQEELARALRDFGLRPRRPEKGLQLSPRLVAAVLGDALLETLFQAGVLGGRPRRGRRGTVVEIAQGTDLLQGLREGVQGGGALSGGRPPRGLHCLRLVSRLLLLNPVVSVRVDLDEGIAFAAELRPGDRLVDVVIVMDFDSYGPHTSDFPGEPQTVPVKVHENSSVKERGIVGREGGHSQSVYSSVTERPQFVSPCVRVTDKE